MSDSLNHTHAKKHAEGSMGSYVIGFILSLIFTFIPYYLVVNETITGTGLQVTILGFAIIQMIIQVTFFLHLGRGPKPNWNLFFFISTVGIIVFIGTASVLIMKHLHYNMSPSDKTTKIVNDEGIYQVGGVMTGACQDIKENHTITIKNGFVNPQYTEANECDTLTFINEDNVVREITFGTHPNHGVYAGEEELLVRSGRGKTITLSETGTYDFHDHLHAEVAGQFTVTSE